MDTLTSLFTKIGDSLNSMGWFQAIQWPFWTLLLLLAFCGVHTARFGKKRLLNLAVQGSLKLAIIYMIAAAGYMWTPSIMSFFSQLPFLSVSEDALSLVNPLGLLDRWDSALPHVIVRLYFLLFFINAVSVFDYQTPNFMGWLFFQVIFGAFAVFSYSALSAAIIRFWPGGASTFYIIMAIVLPVVYLLILVFKFVFTFVITGGNTTYQAVYMFLTEQKFGQQFTVSALSFVIVMAYLVVSSLTGHDTLEFGSVSTLGFLLNGLMCTLTLYIFNRYYNGQ